MVYITSDVSTITSLRWVIDLDYFEIFWKVFFFVKCPTETKEVSVFSVRLRFVEHNDDI